MNLRILTYEVTPISMIHFELVDSSGWRQKRAKTSKT